MSARNDLAQLLEGDDCYDRDPDGPGWLINSGRAADVVWAAGWRKMPSVEELIDALSDDLNWNPGQEHPHLLMVNMAESILALMDGPIETGEK